MFSKMFSYKMNLKKSSFLYTSKNYLKILEINISFAVGKNFLICRNWHHNKHTRSSRNYFKIILKVFK